MRKTLDAIDRVADFSGFLAMLMLAALVGSMMFEVIARYVFGTPTIWAFDISYMLNGTIFLMGAAYALKEDAHVRIDFLSTRLPLRFQQLLNAFIYALVLAPIFGALTWFALRKALRAFERGQVEMVSPWAPLMWPFYTVLALGLLFMTLQLLAEAARFALSDKAPGATGHELADTEAL